ncbi:MAG: 4Fe-4S binding protein [Spirochaetes bacterium]|nr:4Fe-4S binding protein [Spirochaetota bacterium]
MTVKVTASRCPQNHRCPIINICPVGAIKQEGFAAPEIDYDKCTGCGKCIKYCAFRAFSN